MPTVNVAIDGSDVYLKGFTHYLPEAWIKGTLSEDGKSITFPGDQYFGSYDDGPYALYEFYLLPRLVRQASLTSPVSVSTHLRRA